MKQAAAQHAKSAKQCLLMLADALTGGEKRRVTKFDRGGWTRTWPAAGTMFCYMFSHEAHHRGQILMLAHQMGFRFPEKGEAYSIWQWDRFLARGGTEDAVEVKDDQRSFARQDGRGRLSLHGRPFDFSNDPHDERGLSCRFAQARGVGLETRREP